MSSRGKRFKPILRLAERDTESAEQAVQQTRQQLAAAVTQRDQLLRYRAEYAQFQSGVQTAASVLRQRSFVQGLDVAAEQQTQQIEALADKVTAMQRQWGQKRQRQLALERVAKRIAEREMNQKTQQEERFMDDQVTARWLQAQRQKPR